MNKPNSYSPPTAHAANFANPIESDERFKRYRLSFALLVSLHLVGTLMYAGTYFELTRTGAVSFLAFLGAAIGSVLLYVTAGLAAAGRSRGLVFFVAAAALMGSSLRGWALHYPWGWVLAFGVMCAVLGGVLTRKMKTT